MIIIPKLQGYYSISINSIEKAKVTLWHRLKCERYRSKVERNKWLAKLPNSNTRPIDDIDVGMLTAFKNPIQLGISLLNPGGRVYIPAGSYTQTWTGDTDDKIRPVSYCKIHGAGYSTIINAAKDSGQSGAFQVFNIDTLEHVDISDIAINGNNATIYAAGDSSEHDHGIYINDSSYVRLHNLRVYNMCGDAIYVDGRGSDCSYVTISNCMLKTTTLDTSSSIGRNGIAIVEQCYKINIINNVIEGGYPAAIDIEPWGVAGSDHVVNEVVISGNNIHDCTSGHGIGVNASSSAASGSVTVSNVIISNNIIENTLNCGLQVISSISSTATVLLENLNVIGNIFKNCSTTNTSYSGVIDVRGYVEGVKIDNNIIDGSGKAGINILATSALNPDKRISITNNEIHDCDNAGILVDSYSGSELNHLILTDNKVYNNSQDSRNKYSGIVVKYCDYAVICNNQSFDDQATNTQKYGYDIQYCDNLRMMNNSCYGNGQGTIVVTGGTQLTFEKDGSIHADKLGAGNSYAMRELHITGEAMVINASDNGLVLANNWDSDTNTISPKLCFFGAHGNDGKITGPYIQKSEGLSYGRGRLSFYQHTEADYATVVEAMTIDYTGKIGIGDSRPLYQLTVDGDIKISTTSAFRIGGSTESGTDGVRIHTNSDHSYIDHKGGGYLHIRSDDTTGVSDVLKIKSDTISLSSDATCIIGGPLNHNGSTVGFYGTAPIAQATLATGVGATVDNVITALQNLGLVKQS